MIYDVTTFEVSESGRLVSPDSFWDFNDWRNSMQKNTMAFRILQITSSSCEGARRRSFVHVLHESIGPVQT